MGYFSLADNPPYDDASVKADISALQTGKADKTSLATVATTGSYNDLKDKPNTSDYTVFMQETQPTQDGLWVKGSKKDFMFTSKDVPATMSAEALKNDFPIYDASSAYIDGAIYLFGGNVASSTVSKGIYKYIPGDDSPVLISSLPSARTDTVAVAINGKAYIFGGYESGSGANAVYSNEILEFDPLTKAVTTLDCTIKVVTMESAVVINDKAYIFGGYYGPDYSVNNNHYAFEIIEFDPVLKKCTNVSRFPNTLHATSAVAINGKAYIFGGVTSVDSLDSIYMFDPSASTNKCTALSAVLPTTRHNTSATAINGKAYIFGGYHYSFKGQKSYLDDILEFDPVTETITTLPIVLSAEASLSSVATVRNETYIFRNEEPSVDVFTSPSYITFSGYYIKTNEKIGTATKISENNLSNIMNVSLGGQTVEAYSVYNGVATKIE